MKTLMAEEKILGWGDRKGEQLVRTLWVGD
jgi:hypothetical protein